MFKHQYLQIFVHKDICLFFTHLKLCVAVAKHNFKWVKTWITVDLAIFACLNFREFLILGLFTNFRIREFSFLLSSAIIIIIFAKFLNSRICPPRKIREN